MYLHTTYWAKTDVFTTQHKDRFRMPAEYKAAERERDRSGRKRPADDGAKAAQRSRVKREAEALKAAAAYRVVDTHAFISADGHVHLLVAPSEVRASRLEPESRDSLCALPLFY